MHESSKSIFHKIRDARYATRYLVGHGIDIGAGPDGLGLHAELFPLMRSCRSWDLPDGDAQLMQSVADDSFDFVHSSHCLEHMHDPRMALHHWVRILRPGGHLIVLVPDEDLYEQGVFPSTFNGDHKFSFTVHKKTSWSPKSISLFELIASLEHAVDVLRIELLDATFRYGLQASARAQGQRLDQTLTPTGECAIEFILRKRRAVAQP